MNYGKIENDAVNILPKDDPEALPIVLSPSPQEGPPDGYYYESKWENKGDYILQVWFIEETQLAEDILNILLGED